MHACSCAFSYVGLMKQASERHSFLCHSCWDGMVWGGVGMHGVESGILLNFDIAGLLTL